MRALNLTGSPVLLYTADITKEAPPFQIESHWQLSGTFQRMEAEHG